MSLENEMLIQRLFPESQMEKYIRPVAKKYLDRVSSGEQLVLKNTVGDMPLNSLSIYGKSTQNTTSGVQLYDVNKAERNANVSVDDNGWITVRYDNTEREDAWYISADVNVSELIQTSKTYTFVCEIKTLVGGQLNAVTKYVDARAGQFETEARYNSTGTFAKQIIAKDNFDDCATMLRTVFTVNPSENGECAFRISVLDDATITADTFIYEPFTGGIPSPNPDYPQKIVSIGDDGGVDVDVYGANLLDTHAFALNSNEELNISNDGYEIVAKGRKPWALSSQSILYLLGKTVYATFDDFDATGTKATINIQEVKKSGTRYIPVKNKENRITFSDDCHRLYLRVISNDSGAEKEENNVVTVKGLRITAGSGVQWGSYKARQTLSVRTTNGLPGIPVTENTLANYTDFDGQMWCCDEVDFERGVHVKRIEKMNLTSDLGYKIEAEKAYTRFKILCDSKMVKERIQVISNRFTYGATHKVGTAFTYSGYIYIYPPKTVTTVDELKTWLDANPTEVFYILENPIEKQITEEEMEAFENLKTNENVTTVLNSESAYMSVGYKVPLPRQSKNSALKMWFREHPII